MSAKWSKNQTDASKRKCLLLITDDAGMPASPGLDFITAGAVFVVGANTPDADLASGTVVNVRRPLAMSDDTVESVDAGADTLTLTAHGLQTGDGPVRVSTSGSLPTGLSGGTDYYVIKVDADTIKLSTTLAGSYAGTVNGISSTGSGTHTLDLTGVGTERGVWGWYVYTASQAETNHDFTEMAVLVDGTVGAESFLRMNGGGSLTTITMEAAAADIWGTVIEGAYTAEDLLRGIARTHMANFSDAGSVRTFRDLADSKDSHHGTITGSGRTGATIDDLT